MFSAVDRLSVEAKASALSLESQGCRWMANSSLQRAEATKIAQCIACSSADNFKDFRVLFLGHDAAG